VKYFKCWKEKNPATYNCCKITHSSKVEKKQRISQTKAEGIHHQELAVEEMWK
jgi:hypothetical protein